MRPSRIVRLLRSDAELQPLVEKALEINALSRLCGDFLPPELAQRVRAANLKDGQLVVLAATPAAAAKLRLLSESLCEFLSKRGAKVNSVSVRVQPGDARETGVRKAARKLSPQAAGSLRKLHQALAESPAKDALKHLLDHQLNPEVGAAGPTLPPAPPRRGRK
ncbi:MAG: DciA family protein [Betaproteobacteria bacterium]